MASPDSNPPTLRQVQASEKMWCGAAASRQRVPLLEGKSEANSQEKHLCQGLVLSPLVLTSGEHLKAGKGGGLAWQTPPKQFFADLANYPCPRHPFPPLLSLTHQVKGGSFLRCSSSPGPGMRGGRRAGASRFQRERGTAMVKRLPISVLVATKFSGHKKKTRRLPQPPVWT